MTRMKYIIFILLMTMINISCEKEIPSNFKNEERKITLNSIIEPDSLITVYLSESLFPDEAFFNPDGSVGYISIDDAAVSLFKDGSPVGELKHTGNGRYTINYYPQVNHQYALKVTSDGFPDINAVSQLPEKIFLDSVKLIHVENPDVYYNLDIKLYFKDTPDKKNYYYLVVLYNDYRLDLMNFAGRNVFVSNDPVFIKHIDQKQFYIFDDEMFDGETYGLNIQVTPNTDVYYDTILYRFYLCSFNEDYYKYFESYNKVVLTTDPDHNPIPLTEPVESYTNVENGFGILGGYQVDEDSLFYIRH